MFRKIQSYVTPTLLSYVDKYIKDFKAEDTQVSLWSGSVTLHNLELRPDIIQQELNIPFTLSSGHIHELSIQVPWMKIISEPIVITINTIECVLKLNDGKQNQPPTVKITKNEENLDAPTGYIQSLANRIISNIAFRCHNVILKYVEEDIVVSVNIKHLYLDNVDGNWVPAFTDITPEDLHKRKLISLSDTTLCLDKRNAAGKIECYLEPLLYKCEIEIKLDSTYGGVLNKRPMNTRIYINSPMLEFNFSYQQIPMIIRIVALFRALKQNGLNIRDNDGNGSANDARSGSLLEMASMNDGSVDDETWSGWMWSFVQPFPLGYSEEQDTSLNTTAIVLFSINFETVLFSFKVPDYTPDASGIYNQRKLRYINICTLELKSVACEASSHGLSRFCFRGGVREIVLSPENVCPCGIADSEAQKTYFESKHNEASKTWPIEYDNESIVEIMNENEMLAVCPAFAFCYLYHLTLPEDFKESSIHSDLEYSNLKEDLSMNFVFGSCTVNLCSGLVHRFTLLKTAADAYDYAPYCAVKPLLKKQDLPPPSTDDYDAFTEYIPKISIKVSAVRPKVHVALWDHFGSVKIPGTAESVHSVTRRKISTNSDQNSTYEKLKNSPSLMFKADTFRMTTVKPMYPNRLTYVTCQFPEPPVIMLDSCYKSISFDMSDLQSFLVHSKGKKLVDALKTTLTPLITQCNFQILGKTLLLPEYWESNESILIYDYNYNVENITVCGSIAKFLAAYHICLGTFPQSETSENHVNSNSSKNTFVLLNTTLLKDAFEDNEMVHLDVNFEGLSVRSINLAKVETYRAVLNGVKIFAIDPPKDISDVSSVNHVWILSAPKSVTMLSSPFLKAVLQLSKSEQYSTFFTLKMEECSFVMDPILCNWLTYRYQRISEESKISKSESAPTLQGVTQVPFVKRTSRRSLEEVVNRISGSNRNNRLSLGHSSSDREKDYIHTSTQTMSQSNAEKPKEKTKTSPEKSPFSNETSLANYLIGEYFKWKNIAIYLEMEGITAYFPTNPVSALNFDSINDAIHGSIVDGDASVERILMLRLPDVTFKSSSLRKNLLCYCIHGLPAKLPSDVWDYGRLSYPLSVSLKNLNCHSLSARDNRVHETNLLKSISLDIAISFTLKMKKSRHKSPDRLSSGKTQEIHLPGKAVSKNIESKPVNEDAIMTEKNIRESSIEDISSIGVCVHIDTELMTLSINQNQIVLLNKVIHGTSELMRILLRGFEHSKRIQGNVSSYTKLDKIQSIDVNKAITEDLLHESFSKDSDLAESSTDETIKDLKAAERKDDSGDEAVSVSVWFQWTISRLCVKAYSNSTSPNQRLKLAFMADDIVSSLDVQNDYLKWKTKVVTASIHHFKRNDDVEPWIVGDYCGVIMKGRENSKRMKSATENCFLFVNITKAKSTSVYNKWRESHRKIKPTYSTSSEYISEIEIALQELDVILNLQSLKPFSYLVTSYLINVHCDNDLGVDSFTESNEYDQSEPYTIARSWDSRKIPLCYFELHHPRIMIPVIEYSKDQNVDNVIIIQMDKIGLAPVVDNPVCRSPLRPDLYQESARRGYLHIPGSELEDRQCQFSMKGISVYTAQWIHLEKSFIIELQSMPSTLSENPALQWNNSALKLSNTFPIMNIIKQVDICAVLALSMFSNAKLVCGPTIDFNVLSDIDVYLSTFQINLLRVLLGEIHSVIEFLTSKRSTESDDSSSTRLHCPYQKYICRYSKDVEFCMERDIPTPSVDTGIVSDVASTNTDTSKTFRSVKRTDVSRSSERQSLTDYYDVFITLGKINLYLFELSPSKEDGDKDGFSTRLLIHAMLTQPNCSYSQCHLITKFQFSIFHFSTNLGSGRLCSGFPAAGDFKTALFETKLGLPDSVSYIYPNFLTVYWEKITGKKQTMKIDVKCPVRITLSINEADELSEIIQSVCRTRESTDEDTTDSNDFMKRLLDSHHTIQISTAQIVLALKDQAESNFELNASFSSLKQTLLFNSRPEKIKSRGIVDSFVVTLKKSNVFSKILINPWTIGFEVSRTWEPWQNCDTNSLNRIYLETDRLLIELSSEHLLILREMLDYWKNHSEDVQNLIRKTIGSREDDHIEANDNFWNEITPNDQHYKDDLRAGAFKFIHGGVGTPLPYQVFIGPRGITWRYPQPRAIMQVHSFPVPFQFTDGTEDVSSGESVCCTLEYFSDVTSSFKYYAKFYIRQDQRVKLDQMKFDQNVVLSSIWRVVMHPSEDELVRERVRNKRAYFDKRRFDADIQDITRNPDDRFSFPIKPQALAACLRIDSYFTPNFVPTLQFTTDVSSIEVNLFHCQRNTPFPYLSNTMDLYQLNGSLQPFHVFSSVVLSSACVEMSWWKNRNALYKFNTDLRVDVVDGSDMLLDKVLELTDVSFISTDERGDEDINVLTHINEVKIRGGPQHVHTVATALEIWKNTLSTIEELPNCDKCIESKADMVLPRYFVRNDTNLTLQFGQLGTEENIRLESRHCHLYSWKTSFNDNERLLLTLSIGMWKSTKGFQIEEPGLTTLKLKNDENSNIMNMIVLVEVLTPVQRSVTFMGQLIVMNTLLMKLSLKLYHKKILQLHGDWPSPSVMIDAKSRGTSLLVNVDTEATIRLSFVDLKSGWSGDIPLKECIKRNMPWLVKIPLQEEIEYMSIWCRVIKDPNHGRTLVILSPLYMIRSYLPMEINVKITSETFENTSVHSLDGKGSIKYVTCPGTTSTKHKMMLYDANAKTYKEDEFIPLNYDQVEQSTFFMKKEDDPDIDDILSDIKQWLDSYKSSDESWPYMFPGDDIRWIPIEHHHNTDIVVRYLNAIKGVDSIMVELTPWALFGNCSGTAVDLENSDRETLSEVSHGHVLIPSPVIFKEMFHVRIRSEGDSYASEPLYVSTTVLGPYEKNKPGCVPLEKYTSFCIDCVKSLYVFNISYDIRQNIHVFRLASKYVFVNKLPFDVMVCPIAMGVSSQNYSNLPINMDEYSITALKTNNSSVGIPLNRFYVLNHADERTFDEESFDLFVCFSLSSNFTSSCPVRINQFSQRRSVTLKKNGTTVPVIISCRDYRGQIYVTAFPDESPQFLIQNKANMPIAVAQVSNESVTSKLYSFNLNEELIPQMVVQECWRSLWHCIIPSSHESYYTMPTQNAQFPELYPTSAGNASNSQSSYLTFSCINCEGGQFSWSMPVNVSTNDLEQFVKLPGYAGDIKVMVKNHCYSTLITVNNVTEDDISACDIRQRLSISIPRDKEAIRIESIVDSIESTAQIVDSSPIAEEKSELSNTPSPDDRTTLRFKINIFCNRMNFVLSNCNNVDLYPKIGDMLSIVFERISIASRQNVQGFTVALKVGNLQMDNPLHSRGGYDFQVVLVRQLPAETKPCDWKSSILSQISNVDDVVADFEDRCLVGVVCNFEHWTQDGRFNSGWKELCISIEPISVYFENTYIAALLDYITDFLPPNVSPACTHESPTTADVVVPEFIIWEASNISSPIQLKRLSIEPLNILLSVHSNMLLYLALDHSRLQFAKFERLDILTSSFKLGHAFTMHYLSEAMFGAGWVVGSLEILGSPNGLARKVSAGLYDLVREPCLGLMRGPWGFLVGVTHGSASLLKHLTQGTVESMSMVMGSVARNLDRLSLDTEHVQRMERARRHRPQGILPALSRGFQGLGLSLLGAIGGIMHEALVVAYGQRKGPTAVAAGLTRGFIGVITKPLSATADLLAFTGQGLLQQAGWDKNPSPRWKCHEREPSIARSENFRLKLGNNAFVKSALLYICQGVNKDTNSDVTLVVNNEWLIILDTNNDKVIEVNDLAFWKIIKCNARTGELVLGLEQTDAMNKSSSSSKLETEVQMDPMLRARIAAYVGIVEETHTKDKIYRLTFPSHVSNHCSTIIHFAQMNSRNQGFPVL